MFTGTNCIRWPWISAAAAPTGTVQREPAAAPSAPPAAAGILPFPVRIPSGPGWPRGSAGCRKNGRTAPPKKRLWRPKAPGSSPISSPTPTPTGTRTGWTAFFGKPWPARKRPAFPSLPARTVWGRGSLRASAGLSRSFPVNLSGSSWAFRPSTIPPPSGSAGDIPPGYFSLPWTVCTIWAFRWWSTPSSACPANPVRTCLKPCRRLTVSGLSA